MGKQKTHPVWDGGKCFSMGITYDFCDFGEKCFWITTRVKSLNS